METVKTRRDSVQWLIVLIVALATLVSVALASGSFDLPGASGERATVERVAAPSRPADRPSTNGGATDAPEGDYHRPADRP